MSKRLLLNVILMINKFFSPAFSSIHHKKAFSILCVGILLFSFLLVSTIQSVVTAQSSNFFADDFENGNFLAWSGYVGAVNVESSVVQAGNYAMQASLSSTQGYVHVDVSAKNQVYLEYYVYFDTLPSVDGAFISTGGMMASANFLCYLRAEYNASLNGAVWNFVTYNNGFEEDYNLNVQNPQAGTWIKIAYDVTVDSTNGSFAFLINDNSVLSVSGKNTANWGGITEIYVGNYWNNVLSGNLYCDSVTAMDSAPQSTPTPSPTPIPTPDSNLTNYLTFHFPMTAHLEVPIFYSLSNSWTTISGNPSQQHTFQPVHNDTIIEVDMPVDNNTWKYLAYDSDPLGSQINLYYSNDTAGVWTAYSENPILNSTLDMFRWPSTTFVDGVFYMFIENYAGNTLQVGTSTDGINYIYYETIMNGGTAWKNPFLWFNPNDNQWYLYTHESVGTSENLIVRHASTLDGLQSASDSVVVSRNQPFGSATIMYYGGRYWLLAEILVGSQWQVVAYYSTTSASSGFVELGNSPILTGDEACPMLFLTSDQSHAYLYTTVNSAVWYVTTREVNLNSDIWS